MDQSIRFCTQKGHQNSFSQHICTHPNCDQYQRLVCGECMADDIHMHKETSNKHLLNLNKFHEKYNQEILALKDNQMERKNTYLHMLGDLKELVQEIQEKTKDIINLINEFETNFISEEDNTQLDQFIQILEQKNVLLYNNKSINQILNIRNYQFNKGRQQKLRESSNRILEVVWQLQLLSDQIIDNNHVLNKQIKTAKKFIERIDEENGFDIISAQISNNLSLLAYGGKDQNVRIHEAGTWRHCKTITTNEWIQICKFTDDSRFLCIGGGTGTLSVYDAQTYEKIYSKKIHQSGILNIICISNTIILTSSIKFIIKSDIEKKQETSIKADDDYIFGLDFDKIRNIIYSGSNKAIKLWNDDKLLFEKLAHQGFVNQIQIISNQNKLISADKNCVKIWSVDNRNYLILIRSIVETSEICNISLCFDNRYIVIINSDQVKIKGLDGEDIQQFDHKVKEINQYSAIQVNNLNWIVIKGKQQPSVLQLELA